jgi:hypothetical protein
VHGAQTGSAAGGCRERKDFFFEKKKQKTFVRLAAAFPDGARQGPKVFWFFFSKKNCLAFFARLRRGC